MKHIDHDIEEAVCRFLALVANRYDMDRAIVYGSRARGTHRPDSDADVAPKGRNWRCKVCGFVGHRDIVGAVNMHPIAYGQVVSFPKRITYLRPGSIRRSSSLGTGQSCLVAARNQAPQKAGPLGHAHEPCNATRSSPALAG